MDPMMLLSLLLFAGVLYFMMIRPAQKKMREQLDMQASLQEGDRVVTASGLYGTLRHLGDRQAIIEVAPGLELTVLRGSLTRKVDPAEEEFEYEDDVDGVAAPTAGPAAATGGLGSTGDHADAAWQPIPGAATPLAQADDGATSPQVALDDAPRGER